MTEHEVSVVICSFQSRHLLQQTLPAWGSNSLVAEIIVVDAESTDGTAALVAGLAASILKPMSLLVLPRQGLAHARKAGADVASHNVLLHVGPDNIVPEPTLHKMLSALCNHSIVSCRTEAYENDSYLGRANDISKARLRVGEVSVVGTPFLVQSGTFWQSAPNSSLKYADDTELCHQISEQGGTIFRVPEYCKELGVSLTWRGIARQRRMWGAGDGQFHAEYQSRWSTSRRARSWAHSIYAELIEPAKCVSMGAYFYALPLFVWAAVFRVSGRIENQIRARICR